MDCSLTKSDEENQEAFSWPSMEPYVKFIQKYYTAEYLANAERNDNSISSEETKRTLRVEKRSGLVIEREYACSSTSSERVDIQSSNSENYNEITADATNTQKTEMDCDISANRASTRSRNISHGSIECSSDEGDNDEALSERSLMIFRDREIDRSLVYESDNENKDPAFSPIYSKNSDCSDIEEGEITHINDLDLGHTIRNVDAEELSAILHDDEIREKRKNILAHLRQHKQITCEMYQTCSTTLYIPQREGKNMTEVTLSSDEDKATGSQFIARGRSRKRHRQGSTTTPEIDIVTIARNTIEVINLNRRARKKRKSADIVEIVDISDD